MSHKFPFWFLPASYFLQSIPGIREVFCPEIPMKKSQQFGASKEISVILRGDIYIYMVPCPVLPPPPPPHGMGPPPPPPIPHTFCTRHCSETYISILLHARRCSETHIFILLDEPSRRIRWVDRAKLWRNANFKLQELLRAVYRTLQCSANGIIYIYISMYIHIHKHQ